MSRFDEMFKVSTKKTQEVDAVLHQLNAPQRNVVLTGTTTTAGTTNTAWSKVVAEGQRKRSDSTTAKDFVMWLNGVVDVLSETPPTQTQWDTIRERIGEQVAAVVYQRMVDMQADTYSPKTSPQYIGSSGVLGTTTLLGTEEALMTSTDGVTWTKT